MGVITAQSFPGMGGDPRIAGERERDSLTRVDPWPKLDPPTAASASPSLGTGSSPSLKSFHLDRLRPVYFLLGQAIWPATQIVQQLRMLQEFNRCRIQPHATSWHVRESGKCHL
jgi:hypothetical protein